MEIEAFERRWWPWKTKVSESFKLNNLLYLHSFMQAFSLPFTHYLKAASTYLSLYTDIGMCACMCLCVLVGGRKRKREWESCVLHRTGIIKSVYSVSQTWSGKKNIAIGWPSAWSSGAGMLAVMGQNCNQRSIMSWKSWILPVNWEE